MKGRSDGGSVIGFALLLPSLDHLGLFCCIGTAPGRVAAGRLRRGKGVSIRPAGDLGIGRAAKGDRWGVPPRVGWGSDLALGLVVLAATWFLYQFVLKPFGSLADANQQVLEKVSGFGVGSIWAYAALAVFYSAIHSGLEEYYWRWFVFGQLRQLTTPGQPIGVSSLGFMAHHVIVLGFYFGWQSPLTYLFSLAVALGGAFWAWLYERTGSLAGPWLSHLLVDAGSSWSVTTSFVTRCKRDRITAGGGVTPFQPLNARHPPFAETPVTTAVNSKLKPRQHHSSVGMAVHTQTASCTRCGVSSAPPPAGRRESPAARPAGKQTWR